MSHEVITCTCSTKLLCPVPGHVSVPPDPVDPWALVDAGREALLHLFAAERQLIAARAAWVSRGLPGYNAFPTSLDRETAAVHAGIVDLRRWLAAATAVAERKTGMKAADRA